MDLPSEMSSERKADRNSREITRGDDQGEEVERGLDSSEIDGKMSSCNPNQLTIFFNGEICVLNDIPPEKVQAILIIAAATAARTASPLASSTWQTALMGSPAAARSELGVLDASASPVLTRLPSFQSSSDVAGAQSPLNEELIPNPGGSDLKLQEGLPLVRRSSLQQFLEKRRERLASRVPYCLPAMAKDGDS